MSTPIRAFHGSPYRFNHFKPCAAGLHFGTYDQAAHAATIKLGRMPLPEYEKLAVNPETGWREAVIYQVELACQRIKRIDDPRTPRKWAKAILAAQSEGFDAIVYANEFEGGTPADSYCIFDPDKVQILDTQ